MINKLNGTTAPNGYMWVSNGKSRFEQGYESKLVKIDEGVKDE